MYMMILFFSAKGENNSTHARKTTALNTKQQRLVVCVMFRQHNTVNFVWQAYRVCLTNRTLSFTVNFRNVKNRSKMSNKTICTGVPNNICGAMFDMLYSHMLWPRPTKSGTVIIVSLKYKYQYQQWSNCKIRARGTLSPPSPPPSLLTYPFSFLFPPLPPLRSKPLKFS